MPTGVLVKHVPHLQPLLLGSGNQVVRDIFQVAGLYNLRKLWSTRMTRSIAQEFEHGWLALAFDIPFWWESVSHVLLPHTRHPAASSSTSICRHIARLLYSSVHDWFTPALIGQRIGTDSGSQPRSQRWRQAAD
jgi:hypothetical protein